jgi:nucleoside-diphosphate-sugar epimerase
MRGIVLVTGAAGGLGRRLLPALEQAGWRTRALIHRRQVNGAAEPLEGSLENDSSLRRATTGAAAVLHLAARTHARRDHDYWRTNVDGTARLLDAARATGVGRFLFVSTRAASAGGGGYSRTKLEAERRVREAGVEHVIIRLPEVYGTGGHEGVDEMLARAWRGAVIPIVGAGEDELCPLHVDDAVSALVSALSSTGAANRTYTLAGECAPARQVAEACIRACGSSSRIVPVPIVAVKVAAAASRAVPLPIYPDQLRRLRSAKPAPSREAAADLGFAPRGLAEGLASAAEAMANGLR